MKSLQYAMLPDDENGAVLRQMLDDGDDLTVARDISFLQVFATREQAETFARGAAGIEGLHVSEPGDDLEGVWEVAATRHMPASHAAISALEAQLAELAQAAGGYPDGWQCEGPELTE